MRITQLQHQMQSFALMANRQPINFNLSASLKQIWYRSESLFKYLIYNFYGLKPIQIPSRFKNKVARIHHKADQRSNQFKALNHQVKAANQIKNLPRRWPYIDRLIGTNANAPLYLKKWRRTFKSDLTNFALVTLAFQNSTTEEEVQWNKLSSLLRQLLNEENKSDSKLDKKFSEELFKMENFLFDKYIGKGCNAAIYEVSLKKPWSEMEQFKDKKFAIKMLFNYDVESDAFAIIKAMNKECVPFDGSFGVEVDNLLGRSNRTKLPSHPNIVKIHGIFVDQIPELPKAKELFKNALPPRLHEQGYGRNMTLFIVMKQYQMNLKEYLKSNYLNPDQSLSLLTQLFNGIEHIYRHSLAHRDLKTDNILIEFDLDQNFPTLLITDFGLCSTSLTIPYLSDEMCIGGNRALTAPEIITAVPGLFSYLDYRKSDLWAVGAIAYELYNNCNPFYPNKNGVFLNSYDYKESDLPKAMNMPVYIEEITREILNRDPSLRPDVEICSTLCNLLMFCDELTLKCIANSRLNEKELMRRINHLLSDTIFFARKNLNKLQLKLKLLFLMDLKVSNVKEAIRYFEI